MSAITGADQVESLEARMVRVEEHLRHTATKADLNALETRMVKWIAGAVVVGSSIVGIIVAIADRLVP